MSTEIHENLVEQIAVAYHDKERQNPLGELTPSWRGLQPVQRHLMRGAVLETLNLVLPILKEEGWLPPTVNDAIREAVRDLSVNELHKSLMNSIMIDREVSGHTTQEGLNGYSEGVEHGTISLAGRILAILPGAK